MKLLITSLLACTLTAAAQTPKSLPLDQIHSQADLDRTVSALDTELFNAYNHCDLNTFSSLIDQDVEFYHDNAGVTLGNKALTDSIRNNICGKTSRTLVPGTLKAYYMKGYGAIEFATHRFHHPGHPEEGIGESQTMILWQYKDGTWHVTRVLSYDHHNVKSSAATHD